MVYNISIIQHQSADFSTEIRNSPEIHHSNRHFGSPNGQVAPVATATIAATAASAASATSAATVATATSITATTWRWERWRTSILYKFWFFRGSN
jgi:hypothetical protein